jgi:hypothetical protein
MLLVTMRDHATRNGRVFTNRRDPGHVAYLAVLDLEASVPQRRSRDAHLLASRSLGCLFRFLNSPWCDSLESITKSTLPFVRTSRGSIAGTSSGASVAPSVASRGAEDPEDCPKTEQAHFDGHRLYWSPANSVIVHGSCTQATNVSHAARCPEAIAHRLFQEKLLAHSVGSDGAVRKLGCPPSERS